MIRLKKSNSVLLALLLLFFATESQAVPIVYASDDGTNQGVVELSVSPVDIELDLWFDPKEQAYGYVLSFASDTGIDFVSWSPASSDSVVNFLSGPNGSFSITEGFLDFNSPISIGTLTITALTSGSELLMAAVTNAATPGFVNREFGFEDILVNQVIARTVSVATNPIPEPRSQGLFAVGLVLVAGTLARRRAAGSGRSPEPA